MNPRKIVVVGSGYVGTVVSACLAGLGHVVVGVDADEARVTRLNSGTAPFTEPELDDVIAGGLAAGTLSFTGDLGSAVAGAEVVFLCLGTPAGSDGQPDLAAIEEVAAQLGPALTGDVVVVTKSTVPIGTNEWIKGRIEEGIRTELDLQVRIASNPEFLRVGTAVRDFLFPDRVVIGTDDDLARAVVVDLYEPILSGNVPPTLAAPRPGPPHLLSTTLPTAETIKYAANAFLATKISFINEIAQICDRVGADVTVVADALGRDARISPLFLRAGLGWGGSCFGKDLAALTNTAYEHGFEPGLLGAVRAVNEYQRGEAVRRLQQHLGTLRGKRIALLGLAFKSGTDDTRDATSLHIAGRLLQLGATVSAFDPVVADVPARPEVRMGSTALDAIHSADAVVLVTDWPEFADLDLGAVATRMRGDLLVDGRNQIDPMAARRAGLRYEGIGRG
jgi:nucleotide sugar dehydrogenase